MGGKKTKKDLHFHCWVKYDIISFEQKSEGTTQIVDSAKDGVNEKVKERNRHSPLFTTPAMTCRDQSACEDLKRRPNFTALCGVLA